MMRGSDAEGKPIPTDVDGQKGAEFPLHIECLAGGLRVMCAKQASGNF